LSKSGEFQVFGIIGGSGLYDIEGLTNKRWIKVDSPFGEPSDELLFGELDDFRLVFLPRHGRGHKIPPNEINFRANIDALKRAGVTDLVSLSAVGSLRENLTPGDFVLVDQFIDKTYAREKSFFGKGVVAHVSMAKPVCARLGSHILKAGKDIGISIVDGGTYIVIEGPQFSTQAESKLYRSWDCDVIGMTNMPEAKLAREAQLCYTSVAMVTDYDCWHPNHEAVNVDGILSVLSVNSNKARSLLKTVATDICTDTKAFQCCCRSSLTFSIITSQESQDPDMLHKLKSITGGV